MSFLSCINYIWGSKIKKKSYSIYMCKYTVYLHTVTKAKNHEITACFISAFFIDNGYMYTLELV